MFFLDFIILEINIFKFTNIAESTYITKFKISTARTHKASLAQNCCDEPSQLLTGRSVLQL